jgi:hypothetical protein
MPGSDSSIAIESDCDPAPDFRARICPCFPGSIEQLVSQIGAIPTNEMLEKSAPTNVIDMECLAAILSGKMLDTLD